MCDRKKPAGLHACASARIGTASARHAASASPAGGFTLIELLATLSVLIVLSTLAAASLSSTVSNNRGFTAQSEFTASLALARSEAMRRGLPVVVSATAPVTTNEFGGGWTVWVDLNGDGAFDSGEPVLRTHEAVPDNAVTILASATKITYGPMGFLTPAGAINLQVCPKSESHKGYAVVIQPSGLIDIDPGLACT